MKGIIAAGILALGMIAATGLFGQFYYAAAKVTAELDIIKQQHQFQWYEHMQAQELERLLKPGRNQAR